MSKPLLSLGAFAVAALAALPVAAKPAAPPACSLSDIAGGSFVDCAGYVSGNLIAGADFKQEQAALELQGLGLAGADGSWLVKIDDLEGATLDFGQMLYGLTYFGVHRGGAGNGGQGTAFYVIDAGAGLSSLDFELAGLSNAALYSTGIAPVPEPGMAAMWAAGLGVFGLLAARRRQQG